MRRRRTERREQAGQAEEVVQAEEAEEGEMVRTTTVRTGRQRVDQGRVKQAQGQRQQTQQPQPPQRPHGYASLAADSSPYCMSCEYVVAYKQVEECGGQALVRCPLYTFMLDQNTLNPNCVTFILANRPLTQTNNTVCTRRKLQAHCCL